MALFHRRPAQGRIEIGEVLEGRPLRVRCLDIIGAALYLAFLSFSSYDWSLIAIFTGYLVGKMVRNGSGGLGGTAYQVLAVVLTYASLGLTYFSIILLQRDQVALFFPLAPGDLISILGQAFLVPLLRMRSSAITIACFGFAPWEAWKLNRPGLFVVSGPHRVVEGRIGRCAETMMPRINNRKIALAFRMNFWWLMC